jgi:hypothetical protein
MKKISKREFVSVRGDFRTFEELGSEDGVSFALLAVYENVGEAPRAVLLSLADGANEINKTLADTANLVAG